MKRVVVAGFLFFATIAGYAQWSDPAADLPAYHTAAPAKSEKLPPVLSGEQLTGPSFHYSWQKTVYQEAAQVQRVIYQLPCYCRCDQALGHKSLHSCFEGTHGAVCSTCAKEGAYAYKMTKAGKTVAQIRAGIEKHEYEQIDLNAL